MRFALALLLLVAACFASSPRALCSDFDYTKIRLITFDGFAALFDTLPSLSKSFRAFFDSSVSDDVVTNFRNCWLGFYSSENWMYYDLLVSNEGVTPPKDPFVSLMMRGLPLCLKQYHLNATDAQQEQLFQMWGKLTPNPGVVTTLFKLSQHNYTLGILSNADDTTQSIMAAQLAPVPITYLFSTSKAGAFKPSGRLYGLTETYAGYAKNQVLHVAGGGFDASGARAYGIYGASCSDVQWLPVPDPTLAPCFQLAHGVPDLANLFHL